MPKGVRRATPRDFEIAFCVLANGAPHKRLQPRPMAIAQRNMHLRRPHMVLAQPEIDQQRRRSVLSQREMGKR